MRMKETTETSQKNDEVLVERGKKYMIEKE